MPTDVTWGPGLAVVAGDVLALRGTGLFAAETWALLCQAAQALQDLFLSNGGVVGGSRAGPVVTPHTLELTPRGRVLLQLAPPETARAYLPPEYRPGRVYSDTDSEKMWMYSLGRALLDTTPRVAALTGTVSVSPSSALQSVLAAMTEPDPRRRASLMNLLDVISEYCRTRLQARPFTHIVMEMYREVMRSPQYAARKRAAYRQMNAKCPTRIIVDQSNHQKTYGYHHYPQHQHQNHNQPSANGQPPSFQHQDRVGQYLSSQLAVQQRHQSLQQNYVPDNQFRSLQQPQGHAQQSSKSQQDYHYNYHNYHVKGAHFRAQSRNSQSHPNLTSLNGTQQQQYQEAILSTCRTQFPSQLDIQSGSRSIGPSTTYHQRRIHHHSRTYSQPVYTRLQHTRSSGNLPTTTNATADGNPDGNVYTDPIYALPVKPFLSSQDVRVNGLSAKPPAIRGGEAYGGSLSINRRPSNTGHSQSDASLQLSERLCEDIYGRVPPGKISLQRQHSNPQLPSRVQTDEDFKRLSQPSVATTESRCGNDGVTRKEEQTIRQQNPVSSMKFRGIQGPPKPPRIITTLRRAALSDSECNSQTEPPAKPPRLLTRNGPKGRRGKAVQRAPSRLYRTLGGPMRCFNKAQCVGPEFVVRANQPAKTLCVGQIKAGNSGRIVVIMLTGQRVEVTCDPQKVTAGDLFQAIVQAENLDENFTLGLAVLLAGDFAMLPPDTKLNKVAPPGWLSSGKSKGLLGLPTSFMLYLRLRFFLPSLRGIRSWISKHLLYLQIRRCILEQQLVCPYSELINLTGLALQAEFGNYNVNEHGCGDYFLLEHYVPEALILNADRHQSQSCIDADTLRAQLHRAHRDRHGLDSNKAEEMFITHAQSLPDYGSHYYIATMDSKELEKLMAQQRKGKNAISNNRNLVVSSSDDLKNAYRQEKSSREVCPAYSKVRSASHEPLIPYANEHATSAKLVGNNNNTSNTNSISSSSNKNKDGKKKTESNVWLAIHSQGLKLLERGGEPRERTELAHFQWREVQTLSYSKSCLVVYSKLNGKRCKFKLRMDHRKSYFAFKLTSLHHQFFLRLRSELTSLQGIAKDFGVPLATEMKTITPLKTKTGDGKTKIAVANTVKVQQKVNYTMQLEEYQNKENENPQKDTNVVVTKDVGREPGFYSSEEDALYAQVNVRLEPEGESRDTEEESDRGLTTSNVILLENIETKTESENKHYGSPGLESETETECTYSLPKVISSNIAEIDKPNNPEELYAAINKVRLTGKSEFSVPDEVLNVQDVKKTLHKMKTSSLPNYSTSRQSSGFRTPSLPRRLGVKMGTRAIYSSLAQKDTALTDDTESLSLKSDTESSIQSLSARSNESPMPEAYVLNTDIRVDDETFRVPEDESMSASLMARLEELSFAEERILHTIKLERGHGGSIGLQVMEGNDGGVYVQAVSVGGSADMAGNVNKGDRIVAINGQNLLNLRYEDALKMLQSSSETIELVLSQPTNRKKVESRDNQDQRTVENNYLHDIKFDVSSEASSMANKWLVQKTTDVASVQNTSSAYSSAASSAMDNETGPPVPPRRTKRKKIIPAPIAPSMTSNGAIANDNVKSQKVLLPMPPEKCRRNKSRFAVESCQPQCDTPASCSSVESVINERHHEYDTTDTETGVIKTKFPRSRDDVIFEISAASNNASDDLVRKSTAPKPFLSSSSKRRAFEEYPPLFFTLRDFEDVMSSTRNRDDSANVPSTNLDDSSSRDSREEESSITRIPDDICFRVTTTNLPFEKCLDRWRDPFDDDKLDQKFDDYRFDDSVNGSDRVNVQKPSGYIFDDNDCSECRAVTKVRFVIKSPSKTPKHDSDKKNDASCDSWQNCEFIFANDEQASVQSIVPSVKLTEIQDESTDVKVCGDNSRNKSSSASEKGNFTTEMEDDAFTPLSVNKAEARLKTVSQVRCDDKSNDINYEKISKEESNWTLQNERVSDETVRSGKENKQMLAMGETAISGEYAVKQTNQSEKLDTLKINENTRRFSSKSLETTCINEQTNISEITQEGVCREKEILFKTATDNTEEKYAAENETTFNESFQNSLNDHADDNANQNTFYDRSKEKISFDDQTNKSARIEETRRLSTEETKETSNPVDSENNREKVSPLEEVFAKNVPVKVRRNSFLETMLSDDTEDIPLNFKVVSTQSVVTSPSINKTLNITKKASDKIELNTGIMKESELGFNKATKVDMGQKVVKDSEKIKNVKVPSTDVRLMQSENKSAGDMKNDVLNELLCNFSNIKLKIISPENKKSTERIGGDENIVCSVTIDNGISRKKETPSSDSLTFEGSRDEGRVPISDKSVDANNDVPIVEKIKKEDFTKMKIEDGPQDRKNDTPDPAIDEKITKSKNIQMTMLEKSSCNIKDETVRDSSPVETKIEEKSSDIAPKETYVEINTEKALATSESVEIKLKSKNSRNIRSPKSILKKARAECERQRTNESQKRIPIGAPATMNMIFDSRELETNVSRGISSDEKKDNVTSKETHRSKEKTDKVNANESAVDQERIASQSLLALETTSRDDKCAIAKKTTSVIPCNNNDNNRAVTPVASISNDQSSRDVVTITPGKVRSFVKYYEIRSDATTNVGSYSKINDREKVARRKSAKSHTAPIAAKNSQRPEVIMGSKGTRGGLGSATSNNVPEISSNKTRLSTSASRHPEDPSDNSVCKTAETRSKVTKKYKKNSHMLDEETREPPDKAGAKKSVQFLGGFTVIHSGTFDRDESPGIVANTSKKKGALPSPRDYKELAREIKSEKLPDAKKGSSQRREAVSQIHAVASHKENPGINCFVPKPEIPQLVFYCTI